MSIFRSMEQMHPRFQLEEKEFLDFCCHNKKTNQALSSHVCVCFFSSIQQSFSLLSNFHDFSFDDQVRIDKIDLGDQIVSKIVQRNFRIDGRD